MATMTGGRPTCVSWLLLVSYAVLLGVGGLGVWLCSINFDHEEALPPTPPEENTTITTTTPAPKRSYYYRNNYEDRVTEAYKNYVSASQRFANLANEVRFYLAPLSVTCVVVAGLTLLGGLFSRQLFSSTFSLYSSLGLWILTLVMTITYQGFLAGNFSTIVRHTAAWILGGHILLLVFLPIQMLLCVWELRRQKVTGWPTINISKVFTLEAILLASRLSLIVFTFKRLMGSQIYFGFNAKLDSQYESFYSNPRDRYPLELSLLCFAAAYYNALATLEATLSMLLGKVHHRMTALTCLLSGLCCITVAVLSSPAFVGFFIGPYIVYFTTMNFAIGMSVLTLLHWLAYIIMPFALRTPPHIIIQIFEGLLQIISHDDVAASMRTNGKRGLEFISKKMKNDVQVKGASLLFAMVSIITIAVDMGNLPGYRTWGHVVLLCASSVTVMLSLLPFMMERCFKEKETISMKKQRLIHIFFVAPAFLLGGIAVCHNSYGLGIFGGLWNIFFALFQISVLLVMWQQYTEKQKHDEEATDTKNLPSYEEITNQEDDQDNPTDDMA